MLEGVLKADFFDFFDSGVCGGFSTGVRDVSESELSVADIWPAPIGISQIHFRNS